MARRLREGTKEWQNRSSASSTLSCSFPNGVMGLASLPFQRSVIGLNKVHCVCLYAVHSYTAEVPHRLRCLSLSGDLRQPSGTLSVPLWVFILYIYRSEWPVSCSHFPSEAIVPLTGFLGSVTILTFWPTRKTGAGWYMSAYLYHCFEGKPTLTLVFWPVEVREVMLMTFWWSREIVPRHALWRLSMKLWLSCIGTFLD